MALFDTKNFNPEVFGQYVDSIPNTKRSELIKSGAIKPDARLIPMFQSQTGSYKATIPMFGRLSGEPENYDGTTDITASATDTYTQQVVVIGRAHGFLEKDFSSDITGGVDFMSQVAMQLNDYWYEAFQSSMLSVLKGVFNSRGTQLSQKKAKDAFISSHTHDISNSAENNTFNETTLNTAIQAACGDAKNAFSLAIMHSKVATDLENLQLLHYLKYTDPSGVQRDLQLGTVNGKTVLIDDGMPTTAGYYDAESTDEGVLKIVADSGSPTDGEIKLKDVAPYFGSKTLEAGMYVKAGMQYTTYVLGSGAITFQEVGVEVPMEMSRDAKTNGGQTTLWTRKRFVIAPYGFSFVGSTVSNSPTPAELEAGDSWSLVDNGNSTYIPNKSIPIARIITQ